MLKGSSTSRFEVKDFCVTIIDLLRDSGFLVVWVLKAAGDYSTEATSVIDLLKGIISQILRLNFALRNETSLALSCAHFRSAEMENDWLKLLISVLAGIPHL